MLLPVLLSKQRDCVGTSRPKAKPTRSTTHPAVKADSRNTLKNHIEKCGQSYFTVRLCRQTVTPEPEVAARATL